MQNKSAYGYIFTAIGISVEVFLMILPTLFPDIPIQTARVLFYFAALLMASGISGLLYLWIPKYKKVFVVFFMVVTIGVAIYVNPGKNIISKGGIEIKFSETWLAMSSWKNQVGSDGDEVILSEPVWRINGIQLNAKNNTGKTIKETNGYIQSNLTNKKIGILIAGSKPDNICPIPNGAEFMIRVIFPRSSTDREGMRIQDFLHQFGSFSLNFKFDEIEIERNFTQKEIERFIDKYTSTVWPENQKSKPRVLKKPCSGILNEKETNT